MLFDFFERRVPPYPPNDPALPPKGFFAFLWACTQGMRGWIGLLTLTSALLSVYEAFLFAVMSRVRFLTGKTDITEQAQTLLDELATRLLQSTVRIRLAAFSGRAGDLSSEARRLSLIAPISSASGRKRTVEKYSAMPSVYQAG